MLNRCKLKVRVGNYNCVGEVGDFGILIKDNPYKGYAWVLLPLGKTQSDHDPTILLRPDDFLICNSNEVDCKTCPHKFICWSSGDATL